MLEYCRIGPLLAGEVACELWQVFFVCLFLLVLGKILSGTERTPEWSLPEPADHIAELLRMLM